MPIINSIEFTIKVVQNSAVSPDLDHKIREGLVECYPKDTDHFSHQRSWHSEPEWIVCACIPDGSVAAHVAMVERVVTVGDDRVWVKVAGPQGVFVRPLWRKKGLIDLIMDTAKKESEKRGVEAGLLFCLPALEDKVYGRMGWIKLDARVYMHDNSGVKVPIDSKNITMALPIHIEEFPRGDIDLNGPDW